jgi:voltage-dependent anion channel protein 2
MPKVVLFKDLGKSARDLLTKDYPYEESKVEVKSITASGLTFTSTGKRDSKGIVSAIIEGKHKVASYATVTDKVSSNGVLSGTLEFHDFGISGLKAVVDGSTNRPDSTKDSQPLFSTAKTSFEFLHEHFTANGSFDFIKGPTLTASLVAGHAGISVGGDTEYNVADKNLTRYSGILSIVRDDFTITGEIRESIGKKEGQQLALSYYHKIGRDIEVGGEFVRSRGTDSNVVTCGLSYVLDSDTTAKAKVTSNGELALALKQRLSPDVTVTLGALLDTDHLDTKQGHKFGVSVALTLD